MVSTLVSIYFGIRPVGHTLKQIVKHFKLLIQRYAQFWFYKGLRRAFAPHFPYDFSRKIFLTLYSIILQSILLLSGCICFLRYWVISILHFLFPSLWRQALIFAFWSSRFPTLSEKVGQKFKYLENKIIVWNEIKSIFHRL